MDAVERDDTIVGTAGPELVEPGKFRLNRIFCSDFDWDEKWLGRFSLTRIG